MDYFCKKASSQMFNRVLSIPLLIVVLLVLMVSIVLIVFCKFYQKTISFKKIDRDKKKKKRVRGGNLHKWDGESKSRIKNLSKS